MNRDELVIASGGAIKSMGDGIVEGYLVYFNEQDLDREHFTKNTRFNLDYYDTRPVFYQHAMDDVLKDHRIGKILSIKADDFGLWARAQLDMADEYQRFIEQMAREGKLGWSSGSAPNLVQKSANGEILNWTIIEGSLTPTPAQPTFTRVTTLKSLASLPSFTSLLKGSAVKANKEADPIAAQDQIQPTTQSEPTNKESTMDPQLIKDLIAQIGAALNLTPEQIAAAEAACMEASAVASMKDDMTTPVDPAMVADAAEAVVEAVAEQVAEVTGAPVDPASLTAATMAAEDLIDTAAKIDGDPTEEQSAAMSKHAKRLIAAFGGAKAAAKRSALANAFKSSNRALPPVSKVGGGFAHPAAKAVSAGNGRSRGRITDVTDLKYDHLTHDTALFVAKTMIAENSPVRPSETLLRVAATKMLRAAERGDEKYEPAVKSMGYLKADEVVSTNLSGAGQEWVGVAYDNHLWEKARASVIYQQLLAAGMYQPSIPDGYNSIWIPTEGTDPVWYSLPEQNDEDSVERLPINGKSSKPSTTRRQLTPGQVGAMVRYTDIFQEDNLIGAAQFLSAQMDKSAQETLEFMILNGDTATSANTNLNLIDSTPSVDSKGRGPAYLAFDGMLKLPIITTTALSFDAGTTFDETDFISTMRLLPKNERQDRSRLMFILDSDSIMAAMNISTIKTRDVFSAATIESGVLTKIFSVPVFESAQIGLANAAGKISSTGANNTRGRLLCVRPDQWAAAFKRQIRTEMARDAEAGATSIISTLRFGIVARTTSGAAAAAYNINVT